MSRLLLFTNDYPFDTGDAGFVGSEIDALAAAFDSVIVFNRSARRDPGSARMPENVHYGGNLWTHGAAHALRGIASPRMATRFVAAAWAELRAGRLLRHPRLFVMGALAGIAAAADRRVRSAAAADEATAAYAFWGMGGGLVLPWLDGVRARVLRLHRYDLYEELAPDGYLPFRPYLFGRADRVLAISDDARDYLSQRYRDPLLDAETVVSRLGVNGPAELRRPPRGAERLVVSCSAVTEVKRVDRILTAVAKLAHESTEPIRWVHFGDGPLLPALRAAASDATPGLTVELRGQTANDQVRAFYAENRVDAFVNLSSSEGVPVSIMEALAYGIPVVATAVGGTPELVGTRLGSGEVVSVDASADAVAASLTRVLDAPDAAYRPREAWERLSDARATSARAAQLIAELL